MKSLNSYLTLKRSKQIQKMFRIRIEFKRAKYLCPYISLPSEFHSVPASNPGCPMVSTRAAPWCTCWELSGELGMPRLLSSLVPPMLSVHYPLGKREELGTFHGITARQMMMPWHVVTQFTTKVETKPGTEPGRLFSTSARAFPHPSILSDPNVVPEI